MPRVKLSSPAKRQRAAARKNRWRRQVGALPLESSQLEHLPARKEPASSASKDDNQSMANSERIASEPVQNVLRERSEHHKQAYLSDAEPLANSQLFDGELEDDRE